MKKNSFISLILCCCSLMLSQAGADSLRLLSTTSTENSGLLGHLLPQFARDSGIEVQVLALGTGQAMRAAQNGDGDLLLVHDQPSEEAFVKAGYGTERLPLMYNDFILVGPKSDPAKINGQKDIVDALKTLASGSALFISRGDNSGTHKAELRLWQAATIDPEQRLSSRYRQVGAGMGHTLNIAASINGYTLVDRGTWLSFHNKQELVVHLEGDRRLFNQYSLILINPARHPHLAHAAAKKFSLWLISDKGQQAIENFQVNGQKLFFPNYREHIEAISQLP